MNKRPLTFLFCFFLILIAISVPALGTQVSPEITQQPVNSYANAGSIISTSVTAVGDDLQYQWYIKNPGQSQFGKSSMTGPAYTLIMTESMSGRQIYCIVSDKYGNTVQTDTVTLKIPTELAIEKEPANQYVADGEPATASVLAAGDELQYTWYLKAPGQEQFRASSVTDSTYSATMSTAISGQQLYCVISDCHGNSVTSDTVTQKIATPIKIIHQPSNVYADIGKTASTYVVAQGDDLIYQWYVKNPGQEAFAKSSMTGDTYSVNMTEQISGRQIRCVITDHLGRVLISDTVTLELPPAICVLQHPANSYAFPGESVTTSVKAEGEALQYHWYLKEPGQTQFSETPVTENTYRTDMTEEMAGSQLYCLITDQKGNQTQTNTATLWTNGVFRKDLEKVKPGSTKNLAANLTFHTANLLHWKSSDPAIASVDALGTVTGMQYGTVTITATDSVTGREAQCSVKVCDVKQVALTFDDGPSPQTKRLLDFLRENNIPVTFFVVGNRMHYYSETLMQAAQDGHEMAYHSYSHKNQTRLSDAKILSDFEKSNDLLKSLTGQEFTLWRTPGGNYNQRVLNCVPLPHIMWSVDTRDWSHLNSHKVYRSVVNSKDGAIVLMHDLYRSTVDGAIRAMETMLEGDYEFLTVTELLRRNGDMPEPYTTYFKAS